MVDFIHNNKDRYGVDARFVQQSRLKQCTMIRLIR